jgi:hypothetical protein
MAATGGYHSPMLYSAPQGSMEIMGFAKGDEKSCLTILGSPSGRHIDVATVSFEVDNIDLVNKNRISTQNNCLDHQPLQLGLLTRITTSSIAPALGFL